MSTFIFSAALTIVGASVVEARPVIIFSGGFGSCFVAGYTSEIKATAQMDEFVERVRAETGLEPAQIRTCYAFGNDEIYVSSDALGTDSETMTREGFHDVVRQTVRAAAEGQDPSTVKIYMWGQSHGGWTAMDLVRKVTGLNYRILMTIDPISVENCGPGVFSGGVLTGYAPGCNEAPADMQPSGKTIAGRVARWVNWYQTQFPHLHSDKIPHAHENIFRSYEDDFWRMSGAHGMMEVDPEIWSDIGRRVISDLRGR